MSEQLYLYETHCHTAPVSACAKASVQDTVRFYQDAGYDGIFLTNHFLDGNIDPAARRMPYEAQIDYYFSDYEAAVREGEKAGLKVFPGVELSYGGTDFLIYGLDQAWYKAHPGIMRMEKRAELEMMMAEGAFVVQAHPYREDSYIDHIRLYPRSVHAVEVINSNQPLLANKMAAHYADAYGLLKTCGSDNHRAGGLFADLKRKGLAAETAGMCSEKPLCSVSDFSRMIRSGELKPFVRSESGEIRIGL